jgi:hypothetical protein
MSLNFRKARMIAMFTWMAFSLLRTLESIATPCSVKARGAYRLPPHPNLEVTICDLKIWASVGVS